MLIELHLDVEHEGALIPPRSAALRESHPLSRRFRTQGKTAGTCGGTNERQNLVTACQMSGQATHKFAERQDRP